MLFNVFEKVDYYEKLLSNTLDNNKKVFYQNRIKKLKQSNEYTVNGLIQHNSKKKEMYFKNKTFERDPHWTGD